MDLSNVNDIESVGKIRVPRLLEFSPKDKKYPLDVPDPYYTGNFEWVYELVECSCIHLLDHIKTKEGL